MQVINEVNDLEEESHPDLQSQQHHEVRSQTVRSSPNQAMVEDKPVLVKLQPLPIMNLLNQEADSMVTKKKSQKKKENVIF